MLLRSVPSTSFREDADGVVRHAPTCPHPRDHPARPAVPTCGLIARKVSIIEPEADRQPQAPKLIEQEGDSDKIWLTSSDSEDACLSRRTAHPGVLTCATEPVCEHKNSRWRKVRYMLTVLAALAREAPDQSLRAGLPPAHCSAGPHATWPAFYPPRGRRSLGQWSSAASARGRRRAGARDAVSGRRRRHKRTGRACQGAHGAVLRVACGGRCGVGARAAVGSAVSAGVCDEEKPAPESIFVKIREGLEHAWAGGGVQGRGGESGMRWWGHGRMLVGADGR